MKLLVLVKSLANQLGLFDSSVEIDGYTRKDGVYVKPHRSTRKKKTGKPTNNKIPYTPDLFADSSPSVTQKTKAPAKYETADMFGGDSIPVVFNSPVKREDLIAAADRENEKTVTDVKPKKAKKKAISANEKELTNAPDQGSVNQSDDFAFGVPEGVTKGERVKLNNTALELLSSKEGDFTTEEREVLSKYSGQGGVGDSLNEFYTRQDVADAMWSVLRNNGFHGGDVLEPSCGTGMFLHTAPDDTKVIGVELDTASAQIAKAIHPGHEVSQGSLEMFATQDVRQFDAVIGNVPFGIRGGLIKDDKPYLSTAEQYFVDTSIDKAKEHGLVALIVPTGIMDGKNNRSFRERVLRKAEFVSAYRLPNTAFAHSHTEVTSDIVIFRKRPQDVGGALSVVDQHSMKELGVWNSEFLAGNYFSNKGLDNVFGKPEAGWRAKAGMGNDFTVVGSMDGVADSIAGMGDGNSTSDLTVQKILENLDDETKARALNATRKPVYEVAELGDVKVIDGITYVLQGEPPRWHRANEEEISSAVTEASEVSLQLDAMFADDESGRDFNRESTIKLLDDYVSQHGIPSKNKDLQLAAKNDKQLYRLIGAVNEDGSYSDMVTGSTSSSEDSDFDNVATRLIIQKGIFSAEEIATAWSGGDKELSLDHLFSSDLYAVDSNGKNWTSMDEYLSGDLWVKYDAMTQALEREGIASHYLDKYKKQLNALEEAIAPKLLEDVECQINSGWIPLAVIEQWYNESYVQPRIDNAGATGWKPDYIKLSYESGLYTVEGGLYDSDLITKYLNRTGVRKDDLSDVEELNLSFKDWLLSSESRDEIEDLYNRKFRGYRAKQYSDAPMNIPGMNPALDVNAYHFSGLRWALDAGKGIVADDVGLGKTARGLMLAKLSKVNGTAKKPTIVVPKSVLANWKEEIDFWFPGSKVLIVGETYSTDKDGNQKSVTDNKQARDRKLHELSQNEYDFVLISRPAFNNIDIDPITKGEYLNDDFWVQRSDALGQAGDKRTKKIRESYNQAMAKREFSDRTDAIYYDDLGIDMLIMDEMHAYKNLFAARSRFGETPKFLGGSGLSNQALDFYYKSRLLRENNNGLGVYGLTATPTKNSPLEIYSMISHIAPEEFTKIGIKNSEDFLDRFCDFKLESILSTSGDIEECSAVSGFKNMDELREIIKRHIDRRTADQVGLRLPERKDITHMIDMSPEQEDVYADLRVRAAESHGSDDTGDAHIFSIMSDMSKAAMDLNLYDSEKYKKSASPKYKEAAKHISEGAKNGGQVVFLNFVDAHEKLTDELVKNGMKRSEIGIINAKSAKSSSQRQNIANKFNAGVLKVVIGNDATMGEGVNLQKNTTDLHHMDLPWEPAAMQQRDGRGLRQGNKSEGIRIHSYLAKGSFDGYRYQTIRSKKDWQDSLWNGGNKLENLAREGSFSRDDMLIMLSADPEEARKQFESNKAAAQERLAAVKRGESSALFVKFQEMKNSFSQLRNRSSKSAMRLEMSINKARDRLSKDKYFDSKSALDKKGPVLMQPQTGDVFHAGVGFEMSGGKDQPMNWSSSKSRWVVTDVSLKHKQITAREYGKPESRTHKFDLEKMGKGTKSFKYDYKEEEKDIGKLAVSSTVKGAVQGGIKRWSKNIDGHTDTALPQKMIDAATNAIQKNSANDSWHMNTQLSAAMHVAIRDSLDSVAPENMHSETTEAIADTIFKTVKFASQGVDINKIKSPVDLASAKPGFIEHNKAALQAHLKSKVLDYSDGTSGPYAFIDRDGEALATPSYDGGKKVNEFDLMLPTKDNHSKAIRAWANEEKTREIATIYGNGRRGSDRAEIVYPKWRFGPHKRNPWASIGPELFGESFVGEAREHLKKDIEHEAKYLAKDFVRTYKTYRPLVEMKGGRAHWPEKAINAMWEKAKTAGELDTKVSDLIGGSADYEYFKHFTNLPVGNMLQQLSRVNSHEDLEKKLQKENEKREASAVS